MSDSGCTVLIVSNQGEISRLIRWALEGDGHDVFEASGVQPGLFEAGRRCPNLVVLSGGHDDGDSIAFIQRLRAWSDIPLVVTSTLMSEAAKITALDAGADDYLVKPFAIAELLARVRALLRRYMLPPSRTSRVVEFGDVIVDLFHRTIDRAGRPLRLTPLEYRLLTQFTAHPNHVLTHRHSLREVWGPSRAEHTHYVRVYMNRLRAKLEAKPSRPCHLLTELGFGYRFSP
jgi:two-component system KDP operon response regulator KdpE